MWSLLLLVVGCAGQDRRAVALIYCVALAGSCGAAIRDDTGRAGVDHGGVCAVLRQLVRGLSLGCWHDGPGQGRAANLRRADIADRVLGRALQVLRGEGFSKQGGPRHRLTAYRVRRCLGPPAVSVREYVDQERRANHHPDNSHPALSTRSRSPAAAPVRGIPASAAPHPPTACPRLGNRRGNPRQGS